MGHGLARIFWLSVFVLGKPQTCVSLWFGCLCKSKLRFPWFFISAHDVSVLNMCHAKPACACRISANLIFIGPHSLQISPRLGMRIDSRSGVSILLLHQSTFWWVKAPMHLIYQGAPHTLEIHGSHCARILIHQLLKDPPKIPSSLSLPRNRAWWR